MKPFSFRSLTATYITALLIVATLTISSHFVLSTTLRETEGTAAIINQAGRQRMLSQRIASLAAQRQLGDTGVTADLNTAITTFQTAHASLSAPFRPPGDTPSEKQLHALYFEGPTPLDTLARDFVDNARRLLTLPPDDPAAAPILAALFTTTRSALLDGLNDATMIQQREGERRVRHLEWLQTSILAVVLTTLMLEALVIFRPMTRRIMRQLTEILKLATTDSLTGISNRRSFMETWERERALAIRQNTALSVLVLDVDHFKNVNDMYGHAAGDTVLQALCQTIRSMIRASDVMGRLGGEEFAVLLPRTAAVAAAGMADRIRLGIGSRLISVGTDEVAVTISVGVATMQGPGESIDAMLKRGDGLMYRAKMGGRNRVVFGN